MDTLNTIQRTPVVKTYLLPHRELVQTLLCRVREYYDAHPEVQPVDLKRFNEFNLLQAIANHVFTQELSDGKDWFIEATLPFMRRLNLPDNVGSVILLELLMSLVQLIGAHFPDMCINDDYNTSIHTTQQGLMMMVKE